MGANLHRERRHFFAAHFFTGGYEEDRLKVIGDIRVKRSDIICCIENGIQQRSSASHPDNFSLIEEFHRKVVREFALRETC